MDGFLLIDKPKGVSSFAMVAKIRWVIKEATGKKLKIGHTGTLDPMATGLLILVLGSYTKRAAEFSKLDKTYEAELTLGKISSTADGEGEITQKSAHQPPQNEVEAALNTFIGEISQVPPSYSAIKVGGQRAYKLARAGKEVKMEARNVTIYSLEDIEYEYPKLKSTVQVSSGTYIRSLAVDVGEKLGTGAYLSGLCRVKVGDFNVKEALDSGQLDYELIKNHLLK